MHERLLNQAIAKAWAWVAIVAVVASTPAALLMGIAHQSLLAMVITWIFFVFLSVFGWPLLGLVSPHLGQLKVQTRLAEDRVQEIVAGLSIALGVSQLRVIEANHASLNVGILRSGYDRVLVVTSGALQGLSRSELESVFAMRLATAECKPLVPLVRVGNWLTLARGFVLLSVAFPVFFIVPVFTVGLVLWATSLFFLVPRLRWWIRVAIDGAAVATTRFPDPLPGALCKIALYNGETIPMGWQAKFGTADSAWITPLANVGTYTTYVGDKKIRESSTEVDGDLRLLLSAQLISDVCIHNKEATLESWNGAAALVKNVQIQFAAGVEEVKIGDYTATLKGLRK